MDSKSQATELSGENVVELVRSQSIRLRLMPATTPGRTIATASYPPFWPEVDWWAMIQQVGHAMQGRPIDGPIGPDPGDFELICRILDASRCCGSLA